jgi:outer membrane protein assembly factor BamA
VKQIFRIFIYLNIYTAFFSVFTAQTLRLTTKSNDSTSQHLIDSINHVKKFKDFKSLQEETRHILQILQKIGCLESELETVEKYNDSAYIANYYVGPKYTRIKIFYSNEDFTKKELLRYSNEISESYFIIPFENLEHTLNSLNIDKTKNGNTFARVSLKNIKAFDSKTLTANINVSNGSKRTIDQILIKGYNQFPESFIKYHAGIKKGMTLENSVLIRKNNELNSLDFVTTTKPPEILFKEDSTTVYFYLKKLKNNNFDGILGFSSGEEKQGLTLNGYINLELNNNLNYGEQFSLNYKSDGNEQQNFRVRLSVPYLFKTPLGIETELKIFKRDSTFLTSNQFAKINYQINTKSKAHIGYKSYQSNNLRNESPTNLLVEDYKSKFLLTGYSFIKNQNNILFPIKSMFQINFEIGTKKNNSTKESQLRAETLFYYIFNLNLKNSILIKNNSRLLSSDTYLTNELYQFGGVNSIRGFNENSIDASFFTVLNTEYRYQFNNNLYLHSIFDIAYFENQNIALREKLYSFGFGIGLQTTSGIIKFGVANGNTENQDFNFSNTKIHVSITSKF